ncbi:VWA domain-containing protein [Paramaledivibacter caminithermalis]|uniref:Mg-chelatase subunit ChlD n=1 Tax=Paramaledivibacter caminithermalis (strain DSM 15212 / CIP 107654 / DViRD3) TaxID=1121301 RepID=A0A1M6JM60_PARC5|nr:VWA domain-containing protein [Paramaledivibacter caminithermalis]SHJ47743.1 Mg-chelatase subunit ChlD [Paramaledivibacter caminithermalis DSM 15212]
MVINFQNHFYLLLIPLLCIFTIYFSRFRTRTDSRKKTILVIRIIIFILIIFALSGINIKTDIDTTTTIFCVDLSQSTSQNKEEFIEFMSKALEFAKNNDRIGVVAFGEKGEVEIPVTEKLENTDFQTKIEKGFTNIENALKLSRALIPDDSKKRIVLLTDGKENIGDSLSEGNLININDIELKIYKTENLLRDEVQLKNIDIPKILYENQSFDVILEIYSNVATKCKITLFSDNSIVGEKDVKLEKGDNRFVFRDRALKSGFKSYKAVIVPERDTFTQNNSYSAFTDIKGKPNVLLIDGKSKGGREFYKILRAASISVDYIDAKEIPNQLSNLLKYKSIIMCDVSLHNVDKKFLDSLQIYVRDYGGGLVVTGGENSYALGGYYKTKLEEILPVDMEMKIKGEVPNLGLMLVIDKSGSMEGGEFGTSKIEIAKEAAIKAVNSLKPNDQIGVITFDDTPKWVVKLQPNQKEDKIKGDISTIRAGGGTSIIPALNEAYDALKDTDTKLKHVILLTDGQAERYGYDEVLDRMKEAGITISTVAVGEGADRNLLETVAEKGKGRYYYVDEYSTIPEIFTKETFLASKTYINNRIFIPKIASNNEIVRSIIDKPITLNGYVSTSSKDRADTILYSDRDEPILASWQYGLGKSVAWTSDSNGKWTSDYLGTDEGIEFFKRMIQSTFYKSGNEELFVEVGTEGDTAKISVTSLKDLSNIYDTKATIITPDIQKLQIDLKAKSISEYFGEFEALEKGTYIINIQQFDNKKLVKSTSEAFTINYSKEYDITSSSNKLDELVRKSKGEFINNPNEVFTKNKKSVYGYKDITDILIIISLMLFILDIGLRRLNIRFTALEQAQKRVYQSVSRIKERRGDLPSQRKKSSMKNIKYEIKDNDYARKESKEKIKKEKTKKTDKHDENTINTGRLLQAKNKRKK